MGGPHCFAVASLSSTYPEPNSFYFDLDIANLSIYSRLLSKCARQRGGAHSCHFQVGPGKTLLRLVLTLPLPGHLAEYRPERRSPCTQDPSRLAGDLSGELEATPPSYVNSCSVRKTSESFGEILTS